MTWIESIARLHSGIDLEPHEVSSIMQTILEGRAEVSEIKEFLLALKKKGESADEVSALVAEMFRHSSPISITDRSVDTVGTGGDGAQTINISTTAAIIAASAGARVVKHGNRAASNSRRPKGRAMRKRVRDRILFRADIPSSDEICSPSTERVRSTYRL